MRRAAIKSGRRPIAAISVAEKTPVKRAAHSSESATSGVAEIGPEIMSKVAGVRATSTTTLVGLRPTRRRQGLIGISEMEVRRLAPTKTTAGRITAGLARRGVSTTSQMASRSITVGAETMGESDACLSRSGPTACAVRPAAESSESGRVSSRVRGTRGQAAQSGPA